MKNKITLKQLTNQLNKSFNRKNQEFILEEWMQKPIDFLLTYYNQDNIPGQIRKGFCLMGNPGRGKTELFKAFNEICDPYDKAICLESTMIADQFSLGGIEALKDLISRYWKEDDTPYNVFIDDIGKEDPKIFMQNGFSLSKMTDVLVLVLDKLDIKFNRKGVRFFATTNLDKKQLYSVDQPCRYDERTFSRICGMVDFIYYGAKIETRDFRIKPNIKSAK